MALVDPFQIPIPRKWADDPQIGPTATYLWKFLHDLWTRTGAGDDQISTATQSGGTETITGTWTFTGAVNFSGISIQVDGVDVVGAQGAAVADAAAATATNPAAPTGYTAHASGAVTVVSSGANDLDTTAAALATLVSEVTTYELAISALIVDVADIRTQLNALLDRVRTHGLIAT